MLWMTKYDVIKYIPRRNFDEVDVGSGAEEDGAADGGGGLQADDEAILSQHRVHFQQMSVLF